MNKIKLIPIVLCPYIFSLFMTMIMCFSELDSSDYLFETIVTLIFIWILYSFIASIIFMCSSIRKGKAAKDLAKLNMVIKLVQIPAYLMNFAIGFLFFILIVGIPVAFWACVIDFVSIVFSGIICLTAAINGKRENLLSTKELILYSVLGFVYCVDVIVSIILYLRVRAKTNHDSEELQEHFS